MSGTSRVDSDRALNLVVEASSSPVEPGATLTYALHYSNQGDSPIDPVSLVLTLPEGTSHASGNELTFDVGRLTPGAGGVVEVSVDVDDALAFGSQLRATAALLEEDTTSRTTRSMSVVPVGSSPLVATVEVGPNPVVSQSLAMVAVTITNPSTQTHTAEVALPMPQGINGILAPNYLPGATCPGGCGPAAMMQWTVTDLAPGQSEVLWVRPQAFNAGNGLLLHVPVNVRTVGEAPRFASTAIRVDSARALNLVVEPSASPVAEGGTLDYVLHYSNQGAVALDPVAITFHVPQGTTHASGESAIVLDVGRLGPGEGEVEIVTVAVDDALAAGAQLRALTEASIGGQPNRASRFASFTPVGAPPFSATLEVTPNPVENLALTTATLTLTNTSGATQSTDVTILLPQGINGFNSANHSADGTCGGGCGPSGIIRWSIEDLGSGDSEVLFVRPQAFGAIAGQLLSFPIDVRPSGASPMRIAGTTRVVAP